MPTKSQTIHEYSDFIKLLREVKKMHTGYSARCPAHADKHNSLSVDEGKDGRILVNCHAGCTAESIVASLSLEMKDLFPSSRRESPAPIATPEQSLPPPPPSPPPTIEMLAAAKGLPVKFLSFYMEQLPFGVKILYRKADGSLANRQRLRTSLIAKEGSRWTKGDEPPIAYGVWRIPRMAEQSDSLLIVEGESNSWAAWYHNIAALGVPGADMAGKLTKEDVFPFSKIYVWRDPDTGGATFVKGVRQRLNELDYTGKMFHVQGPHDPNNNGLPVKDLCDLHTLVLAECGVDPHEFNAISENPATVEKIKNRFKDKLDSEVLSNASENVLEAIPPPPPAEPPAKPPKIQKPTLEDKKATKNTIIQQFALTDMGNADRLIKDYGEDILHCYAWKRWQVWDGKRWNNDEAGGIERKAEQMVKRIVNEAEKTDDKDVYAEIMNHARRSQSAGQIKAAIELARNRRPSSPDQFDTDPFVFNVQNGTVNLQTGRLMFHNRTDMITKLSPARYLKTAIAPTWTEFLRKATGNNPDLLNFIQRIAGYTLTGDTSEHCLFFIHGRGRTGKSVFINTLTHLLGDYGAAVRPDVLMEKPYGNNIPNEIAALVGVRFIATIETESGRKLAEAMLKQFTGGDHISARFLYGEFFRFKPQFKIFLASNHKPVIREQDSAIWERIHLIPFDAYVPREERDLHLEEKLRAEIDGILQWAIEGALMWQRDGLQAPSIVTAATDAYKHEMDVLADFLGDTCILQPGATTIKSSIWNAYLKWCSENKIRHTLSRNAFRQSLLSRGITDAKAGGVRVWHGIKLVNNGVLDDLHGGNYHNTIHSADDDYDDDDDDRDLDRRNGTRNNTTNDSHNDSRNGAGKYRPVAHDPRKDLY